MATVSLAGDCHVSGTYERLCDGLRPVAAFLGVPYAEPPARFRPPEPSRLWTGVRQATSFGAFCPQDLDVLRSIEHPLPADVSRSSEDCLFLNVWTPHVAPPRLLPVMVYVHGGGFNLGFSDIYQGTPLCDRHDVVVVSFNYRLGVFGFLTTGDEVLPGNLGILDQIEALKWVQKYISRFGGDPSNVTVFGNSVGGMCATHLMIMEEAKGLFNRIIAQSGHSLFPAYMVSKERALEDTDAYLKIIGSSLSSPDGSAGVLDKLLSLTTAELYKAQVQSGVRFMCHVDGRLFSETPAKLLRNPVNTPPEVIIGRNNHEGLLSLRKFKDELENVDKTKIRNFVQTSVTYAFGQTDADLVHLMELVMGEYFGAAVEDEPASLLQALTEYLSDQFMCGFDEVIRTLIDPGCSSRVYVYLMTLRPSFTQYDDLPWAGADHLHELPFIFGWNYYYDSFSLTPEEETLARQMRAYWARFAKSGVPRTPQGVQWTGHAADSPAYMQFSEAGCQLQQGEIRPDKAAFWREAVQRCVKPRSPQHY